MFYYFKVNVLFSKVTGAIKLFKEWPNIQKEKKYYVENTNNFWKSNLKFFPGLVRLLVEAICKFSIPYFFYFWKNIHTQVCCRKKLKEHFLYFNFYFISNAFQDRINECCSFLSSWADKRKWRKSSAWGFLVISNFSHEIIIEWISSWQCSMPKVKEFLKSV